MANARDVISIYLFIDVAFQASMSLFPGATVALSYAPGFISKDATVAIGPFTSLLLIAKCGDLALHFFLKDATFRLQK